MESYNCIRMVFYCCCLLLTFGLFVYGTAKFIADESTTAVNAKAFLNTEQDIYPSFSFCLEIDNPKMSWLKQIEINGWLPLYNQKVMQSEYGIDDGDKLRDYVGFLMGIDKMSNGFMRIDKMNEIDYDNATVDFRSFIKQINVFSGNTRVYHWSLGGKQPMPFYVSYRHPVLKCFSIDISKDITSNLKKGASISSIKVEVDNNNTIFNTKSVFSAAYYLHYPKQLMRSLAVAREHLGIDSKVFRKIISIDTIEIMRHRNTRTNKCEESGKDDDLIRRRLVEKTGCKPSYWYDNERYPKCTKFNQMLQLVTPQLYYMDQEFLNEFEINPGIPCNHIFAISYTSKDLAELKEVLPLAAPLTDKQQEKTITKPDHIVRKRAANKGPPDPSILYDIPDTRIIDITFKNSKYKEIKDVQAFNIESYIGNVGGYVGLFIGVAIWQTPDFIEFVFKKSKWIVATLSVFGQQKVLPKIIEVEPKNQD